jgi:hypothetical protein
VGVSGPQQAERLEQPPTAGAAAVPGAWRGARRDVKIDADAARMQRDLLGQQVHHTVVTAEGGVVDGREAQQVTLRVLCAVLQQQLAQSQVTRMRCDE